MSITLTTPYTVSVGGVSVEDDTVGACMSYAMDFVAKILTVVFKIGTLGGSPLNVIPGYYAQQYGNGTIAVAVYLGPTQNGLTQNQWWLNGDLQPAVIPTATLAPFVTQLLGDRNTAETFMAVSGGLMPGTQLPWTSI